MEDGFNVLWGSGGERAIMMLGRGYVCAHSALSHPVAAKSGPSLHLSAAHTVRHICDKKRQQA